MTLWTDGVAALAREAPEPTYKQKRRLPWVERVPIVVTGASGAGKTEVWRRLTGKQARDAASGDVEEGYLFPLRKRSRVTITAIPGQFSKNRYEDLNFYFDPSGRLSGVVFVAAFGFDRVWPPDVDLIANSLDPLTLDTLRQRNVERELESFRETCEQLRRRNMGDRNRRTPWLLVVVNKADLFISELDDAANYYLPGCKSAFDQIVGRLRADIGSAAGFRYDVVPACLRPADYVFSSNRETFRVSSQLAQPCSYSSIELIIQTVKEWSHA
jgi:hypothetical protein